MNNDSYNRQVIAEIGAEAVRVHARTAVANDRRLLLDSIMADTPSAAAAVRTTQREIPVVVLDLLDRLDPSRSCT